ncbi:hypothetical protein WR25_09435 isoform A [Diploscapter pachys]|uniref:Protein kinase domain-containing protein n=1 Tax=Diploscapter pachys TaxID=2018661 RepID=A0A2A2K3Z6_9BILA|nr:hypothetical protein WR25_09435 isoform A [Diploscapter pachys]
MPGRARPDELKDEAAAPPPARRPRLDEVNAEEINTIETEPHINHAIGSTMNPDDTVKSPRGVYKIVEKLGEGGFGKVYLADYTAENASNPEQVALKKIPLHGMDEKEREECKKEAELMKRISESSTNPYIVKYLDSFMITGVNLIIHENLYIAMDYCSLRDLSSKIKENIRSGTHFDPNIVYDYIYQIADGINELHVKHKIAHRDLKPANILIALEGDKEVLKISDFGLVKVIDSLSRSQNHSKQRGTPLYMSPEQRNNIKCRFPVVDIWAIGIIFYELCIAPKILDENKMDDIRGKDTTWLNKMIAKDKSKRMSAGQVRNEARSRGPDPPEWRKDASVAYYKDKLYYLGGYDPKTRKDTNRVNKCTIGIDLGTTRCCVAIVDDTGKVQTIQNDLGGNTTPSWILYNHDEVKVGSAAINAPSTGKNLVYDSKRLIGRQFNDDCVVNDRAGWSFDVGKAMIKITKEHPNGVTDRLIAPEEASGELLKAMKQYAESHLGGQKVTDAVITVPAYFDMRQREATERAAQYAGLTNVRLLTEPTAAAIAIAMKKQKTNRTILIYDLGGGTFDVSIGRITDEKLQILGIGGDTHLGGEDFDELIVKDFIAHFENRHMISFPNNKIMRRKLKDQCREVKENIMGISLGLPIEMTVTIDGENYPLEYNINRAKFNALCESSFACTMRIIDNTLCDAGLSRNQIDDILLVGGSTRIPRIKELIKEKFPRATILQSVNPDEAIAIGAAIYAAQLGRKDKPPPRPEDANDLAASHSNNLYEAAYMALDICEAIPLSIGMELRGGLVKVVIPRGTRYPTKISQDTRTVVDNQPQFRSDIYEGERARTRDNIQIGTILMKGLTPAPRGNLHVTEFHIDHNGILRVTHTEKCSNRKENFTITYDGPRRIATNIAHFVTDAERNREADEQFRKVCDLRRMFETHLYNEKTRIAASTTLPTYKLESAQTIIKEQLEWLDEFPEDYEEIQEKYEEFKNYIFNLNR